MAGETRYGNHVTINEENPEPIGFCDRTGHIFLKRDLVKDMQWCGNRLVWTGFLVGRDYADKPNPSDVPSIIPIDPESVRDARTFLYEETEEIVNQKAVYQAGPDIYSNIVYTNETSKQIQSNLTNTSMMGRPT